MLRKIELGDVISRRLSQKQQLNILSLFHNAHPPPNSTKQLQHPPSLPVPESVEMSAKEQPLQAVKSAVTDEPLTPNFTPKDYSIFFLAGALCCTL